jgi:hypothetical protein
MGIWGSLGGVKWAGREADHSLPPSAEVKNEWSYTSTPNAPWWRGAPLKQRDNFTGYNIFSNVISDRKFNAVKNFNPNALRISFQFRKHLYNDDVKIFN